MSEIYRTNLMQIWFARRNFEDHDFITVDDFMELCRLRQWRNHHDCTNAMRDLGFKLRTLPVDGVPTKCLFRLWKRGDQIPLRYRIVHRQNGDIEATIIPPCPLPLP